MSPPLRSEPLFLPLVVILAMVFLALVLAGWFGQLAYVLAAAALLPTAARTWATFERPSNWAASSALMGLASAAVFAATELADVGRDGGGGPAIIPVAWLFAATGWYTHLRGVRTLRWVVTLVQVSFTSLSALLFVVASARADDRVSVLGYGIAGLAGALAGALAVTGILGRIRVELAKRGR